MMTKRTNNLQHRRLVQIVSIFTILSLGFSDLVEAKWGVPKSGLFCESKGAKRRQTDQEEQVMATSIYNVPLEGTSNFHAKVKLNGTGILKNGKKVTYNNFKPQVNSSSKTGETCDGKIGSVAGSGGICLTPFFSVAADPRYYSIGDIICVPGLKGTMVSVPGRSPIEHTGCLVVGDKGSAIKTENRFDFYTGVSEINASNPFKKFADKKSCDQKFTVIRAGSSEWSGKIAEIESAWNNGYSNGALLARYSGVKASKKTGPLASRVR